jgi:hypothetical protein
MKVTLNPLLCPLCALAGLLASGCAVAPEPVWSYRNADSGAQWFNGLQVNRYQGEGLAFAASFQAMPHEMLPYHLDSTRSASFLVEIRNLSDSAVLIDPSRFGLRLSQGGRALAAVDPERMIDETGKDIAREEARYAGTPLENASGAVAFAAYFATLGNQKANREAEKNLDDNLHMEECKTRDHEAAMKAWPPARKPGRTAPSARPPWPRAKP